MLRNIHWGRLVKRISKLNVGWKTFPGLLDLSLWMSNLPNKEITNASYMINSSTHTHIDTLFADFYLSKLSLSLYKKSFQTT